MRFLVALLVLFAAIIGYGAHRQSQARLKQLSRVTALQDSLLREDSLALYGGVDSATAAQMAKRGSLPPQYRRSDRPEPIKVLRPRPKYVEMKPGATNRH